MKRRAAEKKKFSVEAPENRWYWIGGFGLMHVLCIGFTVYFFVHFGTRDIFVWLLALILIGPLLYVDYELHRTRLLSRTFLKYQFKEDGIHCSGLGVRKYVIAWDSIRTYGLGGVIKEITDQYGNPLTDKHGFSMFFFSQEPNESFSERPYARQSQMLLEYRKDAWDAATAHMPEDMKINLDQCIRNRRDEFFQR